MVDLDKLLYISTIDVQSLCIFLLYASLQRVCSSLGLPLYPERTTDDIRTSRLLLWFSITVFSLLEEN
eukprot:c47009_g1_i1 orf=166-369(+)